ncbi:hypothetical protein [Nocardiopsis sp. YSL2]|uniref:hypothetical protein n=1 Tax=Nocardiopsis sp. YSL2 TaxID=2939492 RepID=UPI0026F4671D|nr:hypothetical protein [Nocardiopsis sp. YSL2]
MIDQIRREGRRSGFGADAAGRETSAWIPLDVELLKSLFRADSRMMFGLRALPLICEAFR